MNQYDRANITDRQGQQDPHQRAKNIIKQLDINDDHKLNKDEFINGYFIFNFCSFFSNTNFVEYFRCKNDEHIRKLLAPDS